MHTAASRPASVHSRATLFSCRLTAARPALQRLRGGAVESLVARRSPAQQLVAAKAEEASGGGGIDFGLLAAFAGW